MRGLLTAYFDLNAVPGARFFETLAHFTALPHERDKCLELCAAASRDDLYAYAHRPRRTVVEALADFPGTRGRIPLPVLFDLFPRLRPRAYSLSSAPVQVTAAGAGAAGTAIVSVTVAIVRYATRMAVPRLGVCSAWLASLADEQAA